MNNSPNSQPSQLSLKSYVNSAVPSNNNSYQPSNSPNPYQQRNIPRPRDSLRDSRSPNSDSDNGITSRNAQQRHEHMRTGNTRIAQTEAQIEIVPLRSSIEDKPDYTLK